MKDKRKKKKSKIKEPIKCYICSVNHRDAEYLVKANEEIGYTVHLDTEIMEYFVLPYQGEGNAFSKQRV